MFNLFMTILKRDLTLSLRRKSDLAQVIFFFAVVVTLVPLGVGAETNILRSIAPGVGWVAALLAALLSLPRMFATDHEDGTLEQMLVAAEPVPVIVVAKVAAHWIVTGVPMTIFATIFGVMFDLELDVTLVMVASLSKEVSELVGATNPVKIGKLLKDLQLTEEMKDKINKLRKHRELEEIQFEDYIGTKK